jgi:hypothetical protein
VTWPWAVGNARLYLLHYYSTDMSRNVMSRSVIYNGYEAYLVRPWSACSEAGSRRCSSTCLYSIYTSAQSADKNWQAKGYSLLNDDISSSQTRQGTMAVVLQSLAGQSSDAVWSVCEPGET